MIDILRASPLFQFKHGSHTCVFYRSQKMLLEVLTPFVAEGLRRGEHVFCVQKTDTLRSLLYDLRFLGVDTDREIERGALELHTEAEVYLPNGAFQPEKMMEMLARSVDRALDSQFTALRTAGEMGWASEDIA